MVLLFLLVVVLSHGNFAANKLLLKTIGYLFRKNRRLAIDYAKMRSELQVEIFKNSVLRGLRK